MRLERMAVGLRLDHDVVSSNRADDINVIARQSIEYDVSQNPGRLFGIMLELIYHAAPHAR